MPDAHRPTYSAPRALLVCALAVAQIAAGPPASAEPERIVAVGDLHGDAAATRTALRLADLIGPDDRWTGGTTVLVQTGDVMDRADDVRTILDLLDRLEEEASAVGGRVIQLLGNHEVLNLQGDCLSATAGDQAAFGGPEARRTALSPRGAYGRRLRDLDAVVRVGETVFVHAGVPREWASLGVEGINEAVRQALAAGDGPILGKKGPLWYRGYLRDPEAEACREASDVLGVLGARRMVVGHTVQDGGRPVARCQGAVVGIDTGASRAMRGMPSALEIVRGDARALLPEGVVDLPDPAP
ncbi:MAG: metallophosphoesterase [Deltaproteobacteria bacterium]|nr:metallophosphoesterase [Deltaproteobacteria bacterium]